MNQQNLDELKDIIQVRIDCLLVMIDGNARTARIAKDANGNNMFAADINSQQGRGIEDHAIQQAQEELTQLTHALSWLESDQAGICEGCGKQIPMERLRRVPTTRKCDNCT